MVKEHRAQSWSAQAFHADVNVVNAVNAVNVVNAVNAVHVIHVINAHAMILLK